MARQFRSYRPLLIPAALALPLVMACHHQSSGASQTVPGVAQTDLTGVWAFVPEESDGYGRGRSGGGSPGIGGPMSGGGRGGRGGRGGGGGGGFGGGRGGATGEGSEGQGSGRRMPSDSSVGRPPQQLTIEQTDSTVTFHGLGAGALTLFFDGRIVQLPNHENAVPIQVAGHWHNRRYEVERRIGSVTILESYERSKDRTKLTVRTHFEDLFGAQPEVRRVYDWVRRPDDGTTQAPRS